MSYGRVEGLSSLLNRFPNMVRFAATFAIWTDTLLRLDRAPTLPTVDADRSNNFPSVRLTLRLFGMWWRLAAPVLHSARVRSAAGATSAKKIPEVLKTS